MSYFISRYKFLACKNTATTYRYTDIVKNLDYFCNTTIYEDFISEITEGVLRNFSEVFFDRTVDKIYLKIL